MAVYLRAVGFSSLEIEDVSKIKDKVLFHPEKSQTVGLDDGRIFAQYCRSVGEGIGVRLSGFLNEKERLIKPALIPHVEADPYMEIKTPVCELHVIGDDLIITYEDNSSDNEIAFSLQSRLAYEQDGKAFADVLQNKDVEKCINVSGISVFGTVLLSVAKEESDEMDEEERFYNNLVIRSKSGDLEARELLTVYEEQSLDIIQERLKEEDLFSVVDSYFLPVLHTEDVSLYDLLGTIKKVSEVLNTESGELVYKLDINTTGVDLQIFINREDLLGVPIEGMRFMGNCRLQGDVKILG